MRKNDSPPKREYSESEVEDALAGLIASTKRVHRKLNLLEISRKLEIARKALGNLKNVSNAIGLSTEMLRQFSRVAKLAPEVRGLVGKGVIQSVDIADRISRLPSPDQLPLARAVARGELTSDDVRAVVSLRKQLPKMEISKVIHRVTSSRNIREYIVQFLLPSGEDKVKDIEARFIRLLGKEGLCSLSFKNGVGTLILNAAGKRRFQDIAKAKSLTKRALVNRIIFGEVK